MKIIYIAHPIGEDVKENLKDLYRILRHINLNHPNIVPFAPYVSDIMCLKDDVPDERIRGLRNHAELFKRKMIDEVWLTGDSISIGMQQEVEMANAYEIPVLNKIGEL